MNHLPEKRTNKGQVLIEILVAMGLTAIIIPSILTLVVASYEGKAQTEKRLIATGYLREAREAFRSVRESSWTVIAADGTYHPKISGSAWTLAAGVDDTGEFHRSVFIESIKRDASGAIADVGTLDASTKKITYAVSWDQPRPDSVSSTEYVTRFLGNNVITHTTENDFNAGTNTNTVVTASGGGAVELAAQTGAQSFTDDYTTSTNYSFDSQKIEVTGGFAQLKGTGTPVSGVTTNSGFTSNLSGWTFAQLGNDVNQSATHKNSGGNPGGYAQLNFPKDRNTIAGGYMYQSFITTATNPSSTLTFQWTVTDFQAPVDSFHLYAFVDPSPGAPAIADAVWDSGSINSTSGWSATVTIDVSAKLTSPGTYYLKIAAVVDYPSTNKGPYRVGYDNVALSWSGIGNVTYPTDSPAIFPNTSFIAQSITSWDSFTAIEIPNGGSIRYQLSDDDGATWKFFDILSQTWNVAANPTDYNDAVTIDVQIGSFPNTNKKIRVKAFLISDGTQQVQLDQIVIGFTGTIGIHQGTFMSATIDATSTVAFNTIAWTESNTPNTTIQLQIATNTDNATWQYVGPDATGTTYFTGGSGAIALSNSIARYLRYQITFSSTTTDIPVVFDVSANYSP